jgi:hypothetical protein
VADGMKNRDSFVRKHFIKFAVKTVVPCMLEILDSVDSKKSAAKQIKIVMRAFTDLLL